MLSLLAATPAAAQSCPNAIDYIDPTYGGKIRQLRKDDGHEHNIYYRRNPWNADGTFLAGVESDLQQQNWQVVLYDGDGCFLKRLFPTTQYDWRLAWDLNDAKILYTWKGSNLYRFDVTTKTAKLLKSFAPLGLKPGGPSLNQAGDRILVITSDSTFRSYRLPDMTNERAFKAAPFPAGCFTDWEDERYIGYRNYIVTGCRSIDGKQKITYIYADTGVLFHRFDGISFGHTDFSPDGQWAYGLMWRPPRQGGPTPLEVHVVNIDGTNDRVVYSVPQPQAVYVTNFHVSWPDRESRYFFVALFPSAFNLPPSYAPPLDEIAIVYPAGGWKYLARTETSLTSRRTGFWREPLASPSATGRRVSFHSARSGTIDQFILTVDQASTTAVGKGCGGKGAPPTLESTLPVLVQTLTVSLANGPARTGGLLVASAPPASPIPLGGGCTVYVDPATVIGAVPVMTDAAGRWSLAVPLPVVPSLRGLRLAMQAVLLPTTGPLGFDLTNGVVISLGD